VDGIRLLKQFSEEVKKDMCIAKGLKGGIRNDNIKRL
jgi:hypothetical protein